MNCSGLKDLFQYLNRTCNYLVLRNWDNLLDENIYGKGHEDIDILCDNLDSFISITGASRIHKEKDRDNYIVSLDNSRVRFDVRWIGDGYYPTEWERRMLERRMLNNQGVYIMCQEDYFYSLAYHALIQKPKVSSEYLKKLNDAYSFLHDTQIALNESDIIGILTDYLHENKYRVELSNDPGVFINQEMISGFPRRFNAKRRIRRFCFNVKSKFNYYFNKVSNLFLRG